MAIALQPTASKAELAAFFDVRNPASANYYKRLRLKPMPTVSEPAQTIWRYHHLAYFTGPGCRSSFRGKVLVCFHGTTAQVQTGVPTEIHRYAFDRVIWSMPTQQRLPCRLRFAPMVLPTKVLARSPAPGGWESLAAPV